MANLVPVLGRAPEAWTDLPDPDAIFVGGSGREISRVVELAYQRLRRRRSAGGQRRQHREPCRRCTTRSAAQSPDVKVWMINVARGTYQLERVRFEALNPTFLLAVVKPSDAGRARAREMRLDYPQLDVIAVGAHPDDVEIACGGTLARLVQQGYQVGIIDLTDGEPTPLRPGPRCGWPKPGARPRRWACRCA